MSSAQKLTTTIRLDPFLEILNGSKKIEYREIKNYWDERLVKYKPPFLLRLINGMSQKAPELTVQVVRVRKNTKKGYYELHLGKIIQSKNTNSLVQFAVKL